ncbi:hypothetical protein [Streptantibioticus silvisoli]|uniref:DUF317 domain-containing protein n=1 Tax=Streptantibioticus silvisoli TaxID=2705255 RepID=A0ABT6W883_9ACTN|nr:hypothetical protein [Streptantibioticus silvisoli]MDI5965691.1 hypothetical protein [Streptantibioticus silvisoli]
MTTTELPEWLPDGRDMEAIRAGIDWDAIRVPAAVAQQVLEILGERTGACIEDVWGETVYWLVPAGTAVDWTAPASQALGVACWVTIPGPSADGGQRWLRSIRKHGVLTGPRLLAEALASCAAGVDR